MQPYEFDMVQSSIADLWKKQDFNLSKLQSCTPHLQKANLEEFVCCYQKILEKTKC